MTPGSPRQRGRRIHVLVCGERERGDDAAALLAIDRLTDLPAEVEVRRVGQLEPNDLLEVPEGDACLVVDALVGVAPGKIACGSLASLLEGPGSQRGKSTGTTGGRTIALGSSHSIAPTEVLGLVRELRGELPAGGYVGVGAASFELGASVSEPVAGAIPALAEAVLREARRLIRPDMPTG